MKLVHETHLIKEDNENRLKNNADTAKPSIADTLWSQHVGLSY